MVRRLGTRPNRTWRFAGLCALLAVTVACDPSRDEEADEEVPTVVINPPSVIESSGAPATGGEASVEPDETEPSVAGAGSGSTRTLGFPFPDYFDVDQLGDEPVRGSGCGLDTFLDDELPDGLWRGFVRSFDGLWVDGSSSLDFDLACVYTGDAAVVARQRWVAEHPGGDPVEVPDGFLVNNNDRVRTVPLAHDFVQVDARRDEAGRCLPPDELPPSGNTEAYLMLDSWLLIGNGEAQWALTSCVP